MDHSIQDISLATDIGKPDDTIFSAGLLHGDAGMAIVYHLLAKAGDDAEAGRIGALLLERVGDNIAMIKALDFEDGIAGVGWAIEWLVQNELLPDVNTDEILSDLDDIIYRDVTACKQQVPGLLHGAMGKAAYFIKRGRSKNPGTHRYIQLAHQECVVMLTDDIDDCFRAAGGALSMAPSWTKTLSAMERQHMRDMAEYILMFGQLVRINEQVVEEAFLDIMTLTEQLVKGFLAAVEDGKAAIQKGDEDTFYDLFYLQACYAYEAKVHGHHYWLEIAADHTSRLHNIGTSMGDLSTEQLFKALSIYSLLNRCQNSVLYKMRLEEVARILRSREQALTIYRGEGSIILAELSLHKPGIIDSWHELFFI